MNWGKLRSPARVTFKNPKISWEIRENLEVKPKTNTQKIPILNLWMNWENICPNLSFTVANKIGSLHKIRPFIFQTYIMNRILHYLKYKSLSKDWENMFSTGRN